MAETGKRWQDDAAGSGRANGGERTLGAQAAAADEEAGRCRGGSRTPGTRFESEGRAETREKALAILRKPDWHDFGPTFAAEQLAKLHRITVGKETLRGWMIEAGLWKPGTRKSEQAHTWRPRRSGFGELVQWDTSDHDWLEGRGPVRYLVRMIDDARSWSWGRFVESDSTVFNMAVRFYCELR